jgi:hypothetical protein
MLVCLTMLLPLALGVPGGRLLARRWPQHRLLLWCGSSCLGLIVYLMLADLIPVGPYASLRWSGKLMTILPFFVLLYVPAWSAAWFRPRSEAAKPEQAVPVAPLTEHAELASLLHDTVGQGLTAIALQVRNASKGEDGRQLQVIDQVTMHTMTELRSVITQLRHGSRESSAVVEEGLIDVVNRFRGIGLAVEFLASGSEEQLPPSLRKVIVRVAREALSNSMKYAPNAAVSVDFEVSTRTRLRVRSSCEVPLLSGFAGRAGPQRWLPWAGGGHGTRMMQRLVTQQGGLLYIGSDQQDFTVAITFPRDDLGEEQAASAPVSGTACAGDLRSAG